MAYWQWGDAANRRVIVCVHGLSRQGRDFDALAQQLCGEFRVVCPDVLGRGQSDWLSDPSGYTVPHYVADMVNLLARLDADELSWVGTSMGGLIGLGMAALANSPLKRLVLNDIGPRIEPASLQRIGGYLGQPARWNTLEEAADAIWAISQGFGPHSREQWLQLTQPQLKSDGQGGFKPHYDPGIAVPFKAATPEAAALGETMLWAAWDSLRLPVLLLRGANSDLLSAATAAEMLRRVPTARLHEFAGVGHAPMLVQPQQRELVAAFLREA
jgi:pimeloyl-ACP methyl ester carboxylesterase